MVWRAKSRLRVTRMSRAVGAPWTARPTGIGALADRQALLGPLSAAGFIKTATTKGTQRTKQRISIKLNLQNPPSKILCGKADRTVAKQP